MYTEREAAMPRFDGYEYVGTFRPMLSSDERREDIEKIFNIFAGNLTGILSVYGVKFYSEKGWVNVYLDRDRWDGDFSPASVKLMNNMAKIGGDLVSLIEMTITIAAK
jgi:hypothetical protein